MSRRSIANAGSEPLLALPTPMFHGPARHSALCPVNDPAPGQCDCGGAKAAPLYTANQLRNFAQEHARSLVAADRAARGCSADTKALDWLDSEEAYRIAKIGNIWYSRASYGSPLRRANSVREAIARAMGVGV